MSEKETQVFQLTKDELVELINKKLKPLQEEIAKKTEEIKKMELEKVEDAINTTKLTGENVSEKSNIDIISEAVDKELE